MRQRRPPEERWAQRTERTTALGVCGLILVLYSGWVYARQLCFLTQSVETIEKKGFVFFESAKKCKRVWKNVKGKDLVSGDL